MKKLLVSLLLVGSLLIALAWLTLDKNPLAEPGTRITREDIVWAKHLFERSVPRARADDTLQTLELPEEDLNRLLNYAVVVKPVSGVVSDLEHGKATLHVTLRVPDNPFGSHLNVTAEFSSWGDLPELNHVQIGSLPLPSMLGKAALMLAQRWLSRDPAYVTLLHSVRSIRVLENRAVMDYQWNPELLTLLERKGAEVLIGAEDKQRLLNAAARVRAILSRYPSQSQQPLHDVLSRLFQQSSTEQAAAENRAALTALGAYVVGISLPQLLEGRGRTTRRAPDILLSLHGRRDAAEHWIIAAAVASNGGGRLANAIGLAKEEADVASGSGFSFTDLAFDRAGARAGELATSPAGAARFARQLAAAKDSTAISPGFADLPEFMPQAVFQKRFDKVGSPAYLKQLADIEQRLQSHPLYKSL